MLQKGREPCQQKSNNRTFHILTPMEGFYLELPLQAHFPISQGQFLSLPPQEQVVLSEPATCSICAFGQDAQAHSPGAQGQFAVSAPQLHVVLFEPGTFLTSDLSQLAQAHWPGSQPQSLAMESHLQEVF
jgi:hypothetical protein